MPSKKKQHNIRLTEEQEARLKALRQRISDRLGGVTVNLTDVVIMAMGRLEQEYPPEPIRSHGRPRKEGS
jgi:hypothetical protein